VNVALENNTGQLLIDEPRGFKFDHLFMPPFLRRFPVANYLIRAECCDLISCSSNVCCCRPLFAERGGDAFGSWVTIAFQRKYFRTIGALTEIAI